MRNSDVSSMPNDTVVILCEVKKSLDDTYVINMTSAAFGTLDVDGDIFNCMDNSSSYESLENNINNLEEGKTYYCFPKTINELKELYEDVNNVNFLAYSYYKDLNESYNIITKTNDKYSIHSIPFSEISKKSDNPIKEIKESGEIKSNYKGKNIEIAKPSIVTPNYNSYVYNGINLLEFEKYLKDRVIGNDKVIERIASTILLNLTYNNPKLVNNMLNIGPTGTGKTYTFELISEYLGVPLLIFNASSLSTAGYQGFDTNDLLKQVYIKADGDIEKANKAIVILDEIDKLKNSKLDIKEQAQNDLLALLGGSDVIVELDSQRGTTCTLNTRSMTFVGCGAFTELFDPAIEHEKAEDKLDPYAKMIYLKEKERQEEEQKLKEEIREKELKRIPIGYHTEEEYNLIRIEKEKKLKEYEEEKQKKKLEQEAKNKKEITDNDLVKYGIKRELIGRLPVRNVFANLDKKGLTSVLLDAKDSILNLKKENYLEQFNTELECSQSFIDGVVELSLKENLGGRSLNKVCSQVFEEIDRQMLIEDHTEHKVLRLTKKNIDDPNSFRFRVKKM